MSKYFNFVSVELQSKLAQVRSYITKHNPTIGVLTEEILRDFLKNHLPKLVSVEQGFVMSRDGEISKQCDILVYDSQAYAPFFRVNDIVVVPSESVIAVIEVKTTITKQIFHGVIDYFSSFDYMENARTYLFIFNSSPLESLKGYFDSYHHQGEYQLFDHDTFQYLPDEITGIDSSFHLKKAAVITDRDMIGYDSWFYEDSEGSEIDALEHFYLSVYSHVESYIEGQFGISIPTKRRNYHVMSAKSIFAIQLFDM